MAPAYRWMGRGRIAFPKGADVPHLACHDPHVLFLMLVSYLFIYVYMYICIQGRIKEVDPQPPKIFLTPCKVELVEEKDEENEHEELNPYKPRDSVAFYCKLIPNQPFFWIYDFQR
jgi:hypothetical protein